MDASHLHAIISQGFSTEIFFAIREFCPELHTDRFFLTTCIHLCLNQCFTIFSIVMDAQEDVMKNFLKSLCLSSHPSWRLLDRDW